MHSDTRLEWVSEHRILYDDHGKHGKKLYLLLVCLEEHEQVLNNEVIKNNFNAVHYISVESAHLCGQDI